MSITIKSPRKMIILAAIVILAVLVILFFRKDASLKKADLAKICIAGVGCALLIFATGKAILKYI
ncbi:MAG: hypothetical protein LIP12_12765 [Clostridiales bacterium]|nr:hypothetical protein [Clostridiales bacterium]